MTLTDHELDLRLEALPRAVDTPREPWDGIKRRLQPARPWFGRISAAAALAASVTLAVLVVESPEPTRDSPAAVVISAEVEAMRSQSGVRNLPVSPHINGGLAGAWEANQDAIDELEAALDNHPDNPMLIQFLAQARLRQSDMITEAAVGGAAAAYRSI